MKLNKNIAVSENGFIFNPVTGDSFSTNPLGQDIIRMMNEHMDKQDIVKAIVQKYETESSTVEKDLNDFYQMLLSYQLVSKHE